MRSFASVYKKNVLPPVTIEIEKGDAPAHGLDEKTVRRFSAELTPGDAGFAGDFGEDRSFADWGLSSQWSWTPRENGGKENSAETNWKFSAHG